MDVENTKTQMRKGILEFCILNIIRNKESYASEVIGQLKKAELIVVEGTVYPLLTRLKNAELLEYKWEESTSGPPRKYYKLTNPGQLFLTELESTWQGLKMAVEVVTTEKNEK